MPEAGAQVQINDFRWRADDGSESGATWLAAENAQITITDGSKIRLRFGGEETVGNFGDLGGATVEYRINGGSWGTVPSSGFGSWVELTTSTHYADLDDCTKQLSTSGSLATNNDGMSENDSNLSAVVDAFGGMETEIALLPKVPGLTDGDELEFRLNGGNVTSFPATPPKFTYSAPASGGGGDLEMAGFG